MKSPQEVSDFPQGLHDPLGRFVCEVAEAARVPIEDSRGKWRVSVGRPHMRLCSGFLCAGMWAPWSPGGGLCAGSPWGPVVSARSLGGRELYVLSLWGLSKFFVLGLCSSARSLWGSPLECICRRTWCEAFCHLCGKRVR